MGMVETNAFHKGLKLLIDGDIWEIMEYAHSKMAQRRPVMKTKLRNIVTGSVQEMSFSAGEVFKTPDLDRRPVSFLYSDEIAYHFMDTENYEQYAIDKETVGDAAKYLKDQQECSILFFDEKVIDVELPTVVELEVTETDPGVKGDTVSGGTKPATVETGAVIAVPLFIDVKTAIRVDTRTGKYLERVKK